MREGYRCPLPTATPLPKGQQGAQMHTANNNHLPAQVTGGTMGKKRWDVAHCIRVHSLHWDQIIAPNARSVMECHVLLSELSLEEEDAAISASSLAK
jgi:hypothetical protein